MMFAGERGSQTVVTIYKVRAWLLHIWLRGRFLLEISEASGRDEGEKVVVD